MKSKKQIILFMKKRGKYIMTGKAAGKRQENRAGSGRSYIIYDRCEDCPLKVYIDLVCNDNLQALVVKGNPPEEVLVEARERLCAELAELSGDSYHGKVNALIRKIHFYRAGILILAACQRLVAIGEKKKALHFLNEAGVVRVGNMESKSLISRLSGLIREKKVRLQSEENRYRELTKKSGENKLTPAYFTEQLVVLSKYAGFRLSSSITLAEYAAYLKDMKESVEQLKIKSNVKYK